MTARSWLPTGTRPSPSLRRLLGDAIASWASRWFAVDPWRLGELRSTTPSDLAWRGLDEGLALGCSPKAAREVGARMLDVAAENRPEADRELLEELSEECLADLHVRLAALIGAPREAEWRPCVPQPGWSATIGGTRAPLAIAISDALFARLMKQEMPAAAQSPLGSGAAALAALPVTVGAAIGRAALNVADLQELCVGDVVVLDRRHAEPVPISIDARPLARGQVEIVPQGAGPALKILKAPA